MTSSARSAPCSGTGEGRWLELGKDIREDRQHREIEIRCPDGRWVSVALADQPLPWLLERVSMRVYRAYKAEC